MKKSITLLGATGIVGQKIITLLHDSPNFEITELVASERSIGSVYKDTVKWHEHSEIPPEIAKKKIISYIDITNKYVISAIPADMALIIERYLADKGHHIISNASSFRMNKEVPLIIPEINGDHFDLIYDQIATGKIITNPNCATVFLALGLHPLLSLGNLQSVSVVTLQAVSGAGYPGVASLDILGNTIPNIKGEEEKIETEVRKILGTREESAKFNIISHVNRVPVINGHTVIMHLFFENKVTAKDAANIFKGLSISKRELYKYYEDDFSPTSKHLTDNDYRVHIGRVKQGNENSIGLVALGHNLVRGAAGAAIKNLELLVARGY